MMDRLEQDLRRHEAEELRWIRRRPVCWKCREPIGDETAHLLDGDMWICEDCWPNFAKVVLDDGS